jgi:hypothetical protein
MDSSGIASENAPIFSASRVLAWSSLSETEREHFTKFVVENRVSFFQDSDGSWAANVRLYDSAVIEPSAFSGKLKVRNV